MRFRAPPGTGSFSIAGVETKVPDSGCVEMHESMREAMISIGFEIDRATTDFNKEQLIDKIIATGRARLATMSIEDLRQRWDMIVREGASAPSDSVLNVPSAATAAAPLGQDTGAVAGDQTSGADTGAMTDTFDGMKRSELFAWLREHGVFAGQKKDEELRKICRETLAAEIAAGSPSETPPAGQS